MEFSPKHSASCFRRYFYVPVFLSVNWTFSPKFSAVRGILLFSISEKPWIISFLCRENTRFIDKLNHPDGIVTLFCIVL